jgi:TolB protein
MAKKKKSKEKKRQKKSMQLPGDRSFIVLLILLGIVVRLPFLGRFDLVTYDGTYYINHARSFFNSAYRISGFPFGYPAAIALFIPLLRDGVRAAQAVSLLAGLGSLIVFFVLCKRFVARGAAMAAACIVALTPLFIRMSMISMSESMYVFFVLLGLLLYADKKNLYSGLSLGAAAITRPEALGIFAILALLRLRRFWRGALLLIAGFMAVYCLNITAKAVTTGRFEILPKSKLFGTSAQDWRLREDWVESGDMEDSLDKIAEEDKKTTIVSDYIYRMPREFLLLLRHVSFGIMLLALYSICRKRTFLLAALFPFLVFAPFTLRIEDRFIYPYIPVLILCAMIAYEYIRGIKLQRAAQVVIVMSLVLSAILNRGLVLEPVSRGYKWSKMFGEKLACRIEPGDRIADRKPFFAFYSGGEYYQMPVGSYNETIEKLYGEGVEYIVLHAPTIYRIRPKLRPLLFDRAVIGGELRYSQVFFEPGVVALYKLNANLRPLERRVISRATGRSIFGPEWSPDGKLIAFRMLRGSGKGGLYVVSPSGGNPELIVETGNLEDPISWSPDSQRIAYSALSGDNADLFIADLSGETRRITNDPANDDSPSWSSDGSEIIFTSSRSGKSELWSKNIRTGELERLTGSGGARYPSLSPDGSKIAFIRNNTGLFILDRTSMAETKVNLLKTVFLKPSWTPDGSYISVTSGDWGKTDIYLLNSDGTNMVLMTKAAYKQAMPSWDPHMGRLVTVSLTDTETELGILSGVGQYVERLRNPVPSTPFRFND